MKVVLLLAGTLDSLGYVPVYGQETVTPSIAPTPLSMVQLAVYRDFLTTWIADAKTPLHVANTTEPLSIDDDNQGCLKDFPKTHAVAVHSVPAHAFDGLNVLLVDPRLHQKRDPGDAIRNGEPVDDAVRAGIAAGMFTFSEMVFNRDRTRSAFTYSFVCGGLCGNGGTIIFQHKNGKWVQQKNACGSWIS